MYWKRSTSTNDIANNLLHFIDIMIVNSILNNYRKTYRRKVASSILSRNKMQEKDLLMIPSMLYAVKCISIRISEYSIVLQDINQMLHHTEIHTGNFSLIIKNAIGHLLLILKMFWVPSDSNALAVGKCAKLAAWYCVSFEIYSVRIHMVFNTSCLK